MSVNLQKQQIAYLTDVISMMKKSIEELTILVIKRDTEIKTLNATIVINNDYTQHLEKCLDESKVRMQQTKILVDSLIGEIEATQTKRQELKEVILNVIEDNNSHMKDIEYKNALEALQKL